MELLHIGPGYPLEGIPEQEWKYSHNRSICLVSCISCVIGSLSLSTDFNCQHVKYLRNAKKEE